MGNKFDTLLDAFTCVAVVIAVLCSLAMIGSAWGATGDMHWEIIDESAKTAEIRFWLEGTEQEFTISLNGVMPLITCPLCPECPPCPPCQNEEPEETETSITLAWDANDPSENVQGYNLYRGLTSGSYDIQQDVGNVLIYTWDNLDDNVRYYFVATAYRDNLESIYSNEVNWINRTTLTEVVQIPTANLTLRSFSSEEMESEDTRAFYCIDGNTDTIWHSRWSSNPALYPHEVVVDVGEVCWLTQMEYVPRSDGTNGTIAQYEIYISVDEDNWELAKADSFPANFTASLVSFPATRGRYVKFVALSEKNGNDWASIAELNFFKENDTTVVDNIVIDNLDTVHTAQVGLWKPSTIQPHHGVDAAYCVDDGTFSFLPPISVPGMYEIFVWNGDGVGSGRCDNVGIDIAPDQELIVRTYINQQCVAGWTSLGEYQIDSEVKITVNSFASQGCSVGVDGVKLVHIP